MIAKKLNSFGVFLTAGNIFLVFLSSVAFGTFQVYLKNNASTSQLLRGKHFPDHAFALRYPSLIFWYLHKYRNFSYFKASVLQK